MYFLANIDNSYTYQNEALYGAQYELYTTVNPSLTFVIDMSEKQQNNFLNKPLLLNNIQYFKLSPLQSLIDSVIYYLIWLLKKKEN